jgi:hypothetical protein
VCLKGEQRRTETETETEGEDWRLDGEFENLEGAGGFQLACRIIAGLKRDGTASLRGRRGGYTPQYRE